MSNKSINTGRSTNPDKRRSINVETGEHDKIAAIQRMAANTLSLGRAAAGAMLGIYAVSNEDYHSPRLAATVGVIAATDMVDGRLARRAVERLKPKSEDFVPSFGLPHRPSTTRFGKWVDQMSDKFFTHALFLGFGLSEVINGNTFEKAYGTALLVADSYMIWRDKKATEVRFGLEEQNKEVKSRLPGKIKAALGMATLTLAASTLAEQGEWKAAVVAGAIGTVAMASYSLHDLQNQLLIESVVLPSGNTAA